MRHAAHAIAVLLLTVAFDAHADIVLVETLGDDQKNERLVVEIDSLAVGELAGKRAGDEARITLPLSKPVHRYRIHGSSLVDGEKYELIGEGLIVTTKHLDRIADAPTAAQALANYEVLYAELAKAAPQADLAEVRIVRGKPVDAATITAAEKRLGVTLPAGYVTFVTTVGAVRSDQSDPYLQVVAPEQLVNVADHYVRGVAANGWGDDRAYLEQTRERIAKRYLNALRDVVLDVFEMEPSSVLSASKNCAAGESAIVFPTDFELVGVDPGDNPFLELLDYEDDVMGEPECMSYDHAFAISLHDHLLEMADDALYALAPDERTIMLKRVTVDADAKRMTIGLTEGD
jgi:hypothetical protein